MTATAEDRVPSAGELAVFCRPVVTAPAVVRRDGTVLADAWLPDLVRLGELERHLGDTAIEAAVGKAIRAGRLRPRQRRRIMSYPLVIRLMMLAAGLMPDASYCEALARDLIIRGRAAGVILILATQRPSHQIIDPSMRDLFSYRMAFRCTTDSSSDVVLGQGWASRNYTAADIDPLARGVAWLLSETGVPRRIKTAWLDDATIGYLAAYAARLRGTDAA